MARLHGRLPAVLSVQPILTAIAQLAALEAEWWMHMGTGVSA